MFIRPIEDWAAVSIVTLAVIALTLGFGSCKRAEASQLYQESGISGYKSIEPNYDRLADAIYKAEGGAGTNHPYGILAKYKHTTPRQACINTCRNQWKRHKAHECGKDYMTCLRDRYAPINSDTDNGTNKYWLKNVLYFYTIR